MSIKFSIPSFVLVGEAFGTALPAAVVVFSISFKAHVNKQNLFPFLYVSWLPSKVLLTSCSLTGKCLWKLFSTIGKFV